MGCADEKRADRWRHYNRRAGFHAKRAETCDHDRCVHGIDTAATGCIDSSAINLYKFRPAFLVCIDNDRSGEAIAFQGNRNAEIEIIVFDDLIVFEN